MRSMIRFTLLFSFFMILFGCKKQADNPCNGTLNESPPLKIGILLLDKVTGENLILKNALDTPDIKVTIAQTGTILPNRRVIRAAGSPLNGMLEIYVFNDRVDEYSYKAAFNGLGTVSFSYTISKKETINDPCRKYYYPMDGFKSTSHEFESLVLDGKTIPNIIKVWLP